MTTAPGTDVRAALRMLAKHTKEVAANLERVCSTNGELEPEAVRIMALYVVNVNAIVTETCAYLGISEEELKLAETATFNDIMTKKEQYRNERSN